MDLASSSNLPFLILGLGMALSFEFVNGFHDTANAVATVIYTKSLKPWHAVVWSGMWNLIGVLCSSGLVAFAILNLLPVELVMGSGSSAGFTMVLSLLLSAIFWNVGTWWLGLPASSSHTMIGSIMGVGMVNSLMAKGAAFGDGVNWGKAKDVFMALLLSPVIGFVLSGLLLLIVKATVKKPELYVAPKEGEKPPLWIRAILVVTCTGVSFSHGQNDGQKGMGLIMLILIGLVPATFALRMDSSADDLAALSRNAQTAQAIVQTHVPAAAPVAIATEPPPEASAAAEVASTGAPAPAPATAIDTLSLFVKAHGTYSAATFPALAAVNQ